MYDKSNCLIVNVLFFGDLTLIEFCGNIGVLKFGSGRFTQTRKTIL